MSLRASDIDKMWTKLGFTIDYSRRDITAMLVVNDRIVLRTKRSHGAGKLDGEIPHFIRKAMRLNQPQFREAVDCPLSREGYMAILASGGHLPPV
jgi:hypothetical protein